MSSFFDVIWDQPALSLKDEDKAFVLGEAGFELRVLGRLKESIKPSSMGLESFLKRSIWFNAAVTAANISERYLTIGELDSAKDYAQKV